MKASHLVPEILSPYDVRHVPKVAPAPGIFDCPTVPLCVNTFWASHLDGLLERLIYRDAWVGTEDEIDRAIGEINKLLAALKEDNMSCCCNQTLPVVRRVDPSDPTHTQISYDGGLTWITDPNNPNISGTYLPAPVPAGISATKCDAASNGLQHIKDFVQKTQELITVGGDVWTVLGELVVFIVALFTCGPAAVPAIVPVIVGIFGLVLALTGTLWSDYFTSDVYDKILCALYCNIADDGTFTDAQANAAFSKMDTSLPSGLQKTFLMLVLRNQGTRGLNAICAYGSSADADCSSCNCGCGDLDFFIHQGTLISSHVDDDGNCVLVIDSAFTGTHHDVDIYWNGSDAPVIGQNGITLHVESTMPFGTSAGQLAVYNYLYFNNVIVGVNEHINVDPICGTAILFEASSTGEGEAFTVTVTCKRGNEDCS